MPLIPKMCSVHRLYEEFSCAINTPLYNPNNFVDPDLRGYIMSTNGAQFVTRCGDFLWNYTGGKYSINQFPGFIRAYAPEALTPIINFVTPYVNDTFMSDVACAIETKTGFSPLTCFAATVGAGYAGLKAMQWICKRNNVTNPADLIQNILQKNTLSLLNVDYKNIASTIDSVFDGKAEAVLNEIKDKWPEAFNLMSDKLKQEVKEAAKTQEIKTLPTLLEDKKEPFTAIVAQSQVPSKTQSKEMGVGLQESTALAQPFDLKNALSNLFYGDMPSATQVARLQPK